MQNPHPVHEEDPVADLPDKHHGVHLRQLVVLIHDPLEELATLDAVYTDALQACFRARRTHCPHHHPYALLHEQDDLVRGLNGRVQLDQVAVVQLVHNFDLKHHHFLGTREVRGTTQVSPLPALHPQYLRPDFAWTTV